MKIGYTTIMHEPRMKMELSTDEYCLLDLVYRLSTNPTAPVSNWCSMSKDTMQDFLGIPRRTLFHILKRLDERGFLEKSEDGRLLRTTHIWIKNVVNHDFKISVTDSATLALGDSATLALGDSATLALGDSAKLALKNNIYNNNKKEREARAFEFLKLEVPIRMETEFAMRYRKQIKDLDKFVQDFDDVVDIEGLNYFPNILMPRLTKFARNWVANQSRYAPKTEPTNNRPLPSMD